jgi:hypothetical protein
MASQSGRMAYDFSSFSHSELADMARDLVGREIDKRFEAFPEGPDDAMPVDFDRGLGISEVRGVG